MFKFSVFFGFVYILTCPSSCCTSKIQPLFLTPLIEKGDIRGAQRRAEVKPFLPNVKSYSGYLTVDKEYNTNIFFWFFPKTSNWTDAPLMLWLDGGPGSTALYAIFTSSGPYVFKKNKLKNRRLSWTNYFNVLYVDVPVGTGFSFSDSFKGYGGNRTVISGHAFEVLRQFLLLFPAMRKSKLILTSESIGSKHASGLAYTIMTKPSEPKIKIWKIFMGSPFISLEDTVPHFSSYLEAFGLLDGRGRDLFRQQENLALRYLRAKNLDGALETQKKKFGNESLIFQLSGLANKFSLVKDTQPSRMRQYLFVDFVNRDDIKSALHVRNMTFVAHNNSVTHNQKDSMESIRHEWGVLLDNFRVLAFFGQFDLITPYPLHTKVMEKTDWSGNWDYNTRARRRPFRWKQHLCGYYKTAKSYTEVLIRNAGHLVPDDQPLCSLKLLLSFVNGDLD